VGSRERRAHGAAGYAHHSRDLLLTQIGDVTQDDCLARTMASSPDSEPREGSPDAVTRAARRRGCVARYQ
jgi:hypothetical protein